MKATAFQNSRMTSISDEKWHGFQLNYKV